MNKTSKTIYYQNRIAGLTYNDVEPALHAVTMRLTSMGYEVYHPFIGFTDLAPHLGPLYIKDMYQNSRLSDKAAVERSKWLVRLSDIVLVDFSLNSVELPRPAVGAISALNWGDVFDKHTLVVMEPDSTYDHAFIRHAADIVFTTMESAYKYLAELAVLNVSR